MASENLAEKDALSEVARARGMGKSEAYRELQRKSQQVGTAASYSRPLTRS